MASEWSMERVIEDAPNYQIIETSGFVHYSDEFRVYLMGLPPQQRHRIVTEIEDRARIRRFVRYKYSGYRPGY